jgi:enoyl-CoA hydratase/carnithine racemase
VAAVSVENRDGIALVRLNRPERLNAVDAAIRRELPGAMRAAEADPAVRAIVLAGAGERGFCAGQDLDEAAGYTIADVDHWFTSLYAAYAAIRAANKPVVAALHGVCAGAGFQFALYCDLRVGHPELKIGQPEVKTGLGSILGATVMKWYLPLSVNAELSLSGDLISGERAHQLGILNRLVAREQVLERAIAEASALGERPQHAIRLTKERIRELTQAEFDGILPAALAYQRRAYACGEPQRLMKAFVSARKKK